MANYGWFPLDISNPLAYTWSPTGNWGTGADWANLASTTFPPLTGTVPGSGDSAYIVTANVPSSLIPAPYPAPPYNVDITVNSPVQIAALGLGKYQPSASFGFPASSAVIDITGVSFQVTGSIVDRFTGTFPKPIGTVSASGGGIIELASSASLEVGTTVDPNITVHFNDATDKVILDGVSSTAATAVQAQFTNFQAGDIINLSQVSPAGAVISGYSANQLTIQTSGVTDAVLNLPGFSSVAQFSLMPDINSGVDVVTCFVAGTRIRAGSGEVAVEALRAGDLVVTLQAGKQVLRPVRWIGRRRLNLRRYPNVRNVAPIRISAHAFDQDAPCRDLLVSPDHAVHVDGALIPARLLVNGMTIRHEDGLASVEYFHVELDSHSILLAEGLATESYLDTGNRGFFANATVPMVLHPELADERGHAAAQPCAPLLTDAASVRQVRQRLSDRAIDLGRSLTPAETTSDARLRVVARGREFRPIVAESGRYVFALPAGLDEARLASRSARPADARPWLDDRRTLGVSVERILLRSTDGIEEIAVDHPMLSHGWWDVEHAGARMTRWTNGDAVIPLTGVPVLLELAVCSTELAYSLPASGEAPRAA